MFYFFYVNFLYRDFLCFFWFEDNVIRKFIVEYCMNVYFFGNGLSLVVVIFGLRKIVVDGEEKFGKVVLNFVYCNFYVDDGLVLFFIVK